MASPITWSELPTAGTDLTCHECRTEIPDGRPLLIRSLGRRYARIWCYPCKARLDLTRSRDVVAATA